MNKETTKSSASQCADQLTSEDLRELAAKAGKDVTGALIIAFNKGVARGMKAGAVDNVDNLSLVAASVDDSLILLERLLAGYFERTFADDEKCMIQYELNFYRAFATSLLLQLNQAREVLNEIGVKR